MFIFSHLVKVYNIPFNNCIMWKWLISSCLILQSLLASSPINTSDCQNDLCGCLPNKELRFLTYKLKSSHLCRKKLLLLWKIILTFIVQVYIFIYIIFFYIINQNTFTGFLKLPAPKKQHRIISTGFKRQLGAFIWVILSSVITQIC